MPPRRRVPQFVLHLLRSPLGTSLPKRCAGLCLELAKADVHLTGIRPGEPDCAAPSRERKHIGARVPS